MRGAALTLMLAAVLAVPPEESVTVTPKVYPPGVAGVPVRIPFEPNDMPSGALPEMIAQANGPLPPTAPKPCE